MILEQTTKIPFDYIVIAVCVVSLILIYGAAWSAEWFRAKKLSKGKLFTQADPGN